ncbi:MAG: CxxC-x17-CxxC domain-containing protein, partial [Nanoarchaeota archaeon]
MEGFNRDGPRRDSRGPRRDGGRSGGFSGRSDRGPRRDSGRDGGHSGRNDRGPRRDFGGPKEMHKAVCAECGNECEVPFKPAQD